MAAIIAAILFSTSSAIYSDRWYLVIRLLVSIEVLVEAVARVSLDVFHSGAAVAVVMSGFEAALEVSAIKISSHFLKVLIV